MYQFEQVHKHHDDPAFAGSVAQACAAGFEPAPARGIALALAEEAGPAGEPLFDLLIINADDEIACRLGQYHEEEVVAIWRRLGQTTGLPLMLKNEDGSLLEPYPQIGAVALGHLRMRRRHGLLRNRRPRFLTRRKTGQARQGAPVHRGRELTSGARG
jgi:hypothetical protein